jgi:hypothetical protein
LHESIIVIIVVAFPEASPPTDIPTTPQVYRRVVAKVSTAIIVTMNIWIIIFLSSCLRHAQAFHHPSSTARWNNQNCHNRGCKQEIPTLPLNPSASSGISNKGGINVAIARINKTKQSRTELAFFVNPIVAGAVVCGLQASVADIIAQKLQHRKQRSDMQQKTRGNGNKVPKEGGLNCRRTFGFLVYGVLYQGLASEFIYNRLYPMMFGAKTDLATVVQQVVFDLFF